MLHEKNLRAVSFVPADLRLWPDAQFIFCCAVCKNEMAVPLGWVLSSANAPAEPFQREELSGLEEKYGGSFQAARCGFCQRVYLIREEIKETSNNAFRSKITAVWQVDEPAV